MKKTISYIMIICVLVSLGGCVWDPAITYFDYDELKEQIATVELINYENENPKIIKGGRILTKTENGYTPKPLIPEIILKSSKTPVMCCLLISLKWR